MYKRRLIPILFFRNGWMVRSQQFKIHQIIGDPYSHVERMKEWDVDELVILDISTDQNITHNRKDYKIKPVDNILELIRKLSIESHMPLTFGGNIKNINDIETIICNGADKVAINTITNTNPNIITESAKIFGRQAIVSSIDYKIVEGKAIAFSDKGRIMLEEDPIELGKRLEGLGAGEILLQSIDNDGEARGYNYEIINDLVDSVSIPVIACSGAGNKFHILDCFNKTRAEAIAAGNIFHFTENAYPIFKTFLKINRSDIR